MDARMDGGLRQESTDEHEHAHEYDDDYGTKLINLPNSNRQLHMGGSP